MPTRVHELLGNDVPRFLTPAEAARILRRTTRTLRRWEAEGLLHAVRVAGGQPLIPRSELERLIAEGTL